MNFPVFDLHCDTASALLGKNMDTIGSLRENNLHIDLNSAGTLPGYAQCFACFTTTGFEYPNGIHPIQVFEREMIAVLKEIECNSDVIRIAYSAQEIERNRENGLMSGILTMECAAGIDFNPEMLEDLQKIGFRIASLGWNEQNPLTGSHVTGGGLTDLGREFVKEAQRVGILIDVSHISDEGFWDIIEIAEAPVVATHSNSRSVWDVSRNLTDEMFRAICQTGGVAGMNLYGAFLGENPTIDTVCDHIFHFMDMDPDGKHISLGGDLDGCDQLPVSFSGVQDYPKLSTRLLERGLDEKTVQNIFWNNAVGVIK